MKVLLATDGSAFSDAAESWGADHDQVGSHGYRRLTRFLLGKARYDFASAEESNLGHKDSQRTRQTAAGR